MLKYGLVRYRKKWEKPPFIILVSVVRFRLWAPQTIIAKVIEEFGSNVTMNDLFKGFDKLPFDIRMMFNDMIASGDGSGIVSNTSSIADQVTNMIMIFISFTIALLFTFLIIFVIANVLNTIVKMPVLNLANKLLGGVFGALKTA
ncbi:MAG: CvpA family protein, partial [Tissierellales bacterium]|nr:CvpA family protein [Tissierellales bacterium]